MRGGKRAGAGRKRRPQPPGALPLPAAPKPPPKKPGRPKGSRSQATVIREQTIRASHVASAERVLQELTRVGFSDIAKLVDERGTIIPLRDMPIAARAAIASVKVTKYNRNALDGKQEDVVELRLWPKLEALVTLARYHGLLQDKLTIQDDRPFRDRIAKARERLAANKPRG